MHWVRNALVAAGVACGVLGPTAGAVLYAQPVLELVSRAQPDEWFNGIGQPYIPFEDRGDLDGVAKTNFGYIWGATRRGDRLWLGTVANLLCTGENLAELQPDDSPIDGCSFLGGCETNWRVCEGKLSQFPDAPRVLKQVFGDWRPPRIYCYNLLTGETTDKTPDDPLLQQTLGLRSAGSNDELVLLAGPGFAFGVNFFAFDAVTGEYLGAHAFPVFSNIRSWLEHDGALYTTAQVTLPFFAGGAVLRWRGTRRHPFLFEVVGLLDHQGADLCVHRGRMYVSTWAQGSNAALVFGIAPTTPAGLWVSPPLGKGGLRLGHALRWRKVWDITEYEPDPIVARSLWIGPMVSWRGMLYWGTMQIPGTAVRELLAEHPEVTDVDEAIRMTERPTALFRHPDLAAAAAAAAAADADAAHEALQAELLYGDELLPVFQSGVWALTPNGLGAPKFGPAGYGNRNNLYTWTMEVHDDRLYLGTFDDSGLFELDAYLAGDPVSDSLGADLYCFADPEQPAALVDRNGGGNVANHGFRNMISTEHGLFMGTANQANILSAPDPLSGWELLRLAEEP